MPDLKDTPVVTVEQVSRFRAAALEVEKENQELRALVAMQDEALKIARAWLHSAYDFPPQTPECAAMLTSLDAATSSESTVAKWEAEKLLPLQRQVAMLRKLLTDTPHRFRTKEAVEALIDTQATAEAYDREHAEKVLEEALDICESEANEPNEGMSDFADGYDAACKEIREQIKHRIAELRATKVKE